WCCALFFFFSSRRRHTRFSRDWSSDVCSSDLEVDHPRRADRDLPGWFRRTDGQRPEEVLGRTHAPTLRTRAVPGPTPRRPDRRKIGRASCRERVQISGVAASVKERATDVEERT